MENEGNERRTPDKKKKQHENERKPESVMFYLALKTSAITRRSLLLVAN